MNDLFDVVAVQIKRPFETRVMKRGLSRENAEAYIQMAVFRRGVEHEFYTVQPAAHSAGSGER